MIIHITQNMSVYDIMLCFSKPCVHRFLMPDRMSIEWTAEFTMSDITILKWTSILITTVILISILTLIWK